MPIYLPAEERRQILREYGKRFGLRVFIETGTNDGSTPWELVCDFDRLYTIELDIDLHQAAVRRLAAHKNVTCIYGDSGVVLKELIESLQESALVWLDGHYSGPGTARGDKDTPVQQELYAVFASSIPHVILVDDARLFGGGPEHTEEFADYPSLEQVELTADVHGYSYSLQDDIIRLVPYAYN